MSESKTNTNNMSRYAFTEVDGFNQPSPSPRYSKTKPEIRHNAKKIGTDLEDICKEFDLSIDVFN